MLILALLLCIAVSFAARNYEVYDTDKAEDLFIKFIETYNKQYADETEKFKRFEIFKQNLELINKQNAESESAVFGINKFSDLTSEEFIKTYTGLIGSHASSFNKQHPTYTTAPDAFDWRDQNKVTEVKSQENCGSWWAFSAVGNLESQYAIKYNQTLDLSEQQLLDCDEKSDACLGTRDLTYPFMYWMNHGPMMEEDYAYKAVIEACSADDSKAKPKISKYNAYATRDEEAVKQTLYDIGPLSIAVDAWDLVHYESGVIKNCSCSSVNHAVLLVGYGTEEGTPFWVMKNSWGILWGDDGYFKVRRGINACCMTDKPMVTAVLA